MRGREGGREGRKEGGTEGGSEGGKEGRREVRRERERECVGAEIEVEFWSASVQDSGWAASGSCFRADCDEVCPLGNREGGGEGDLADRVIL